MRDQMQQAAVGTRYEHHLPIVIMIATHSGIRVSITMGMTDDVTQGLQSWDEAIVAAQNMVRKFCANMDGNALARTLGLEVA